MDVCVCVCVCVFMIFVLLLVPVLDVTGCPNLKTPPKEIVEKGKKTVIAYLRRLSQGSVKISRTKLMFVGLGGVGKTRYIYWGLKQLKECLMLYL